MDVKVTTDGVLQRDTIYYKSSEALVTSLLQETCEVTVEFTYEDPDGTVAHGKSVMSLNNPNPIDASDLIMTEPYVSYGYVTMGMTIKARVKIDGVEYTEKDMKVEVSSTTDVPLYEDTRYQNGMILIPVGQKLTTLRVKFTKDDAIGYAYVSMVDINQNGQTITTIPKDTQITKNSTKSLHAQYKGFTEKSMDVALLALRGLELDPQTKYNKQNGYFVCGPNQENGYISLQFTFNDNGDIQHGNTFIQIVNKVP